MELLLLLLLLLLYQLSGYLYTTSAFVAVVFQQLHSAINLKSFMLSNANQLIIKKIQTTTKTTSNIKQKKNKMKIGKKPIRVTVKKNTNKKQQIFYF